MASTIWNKYKILKEIKTNSNIKTYLTRMEPIVKEIIPKNKIESEIIFENLKELRDRIKIYDIIEENDKLYIIIDNNEEAISEFDKLITSEEFKIKKEYILKGHVNPISKNEILDLFKMEKAMCKITFNKIENQQIQEGIATGFFCEINNFPIKYALFTNNHVLDEFNTKLGRNISIECLQKTNNSYEFVYKKIKIDGKRKIFSNTKLDYTCIELYESDGIKHFFQIDPLFLTEDKNLLKNTDIFILQYPKGNKISFSYGKILLLKDNRLVHSASTEEGSSGSPIIRRGKENYLIGLHYGGIKNKKENYNFIFNCATIFDSILNDMTKTNEINCIYIKNDNEKEIQLLHDYNEDISKWAKEEQNSYNETKKLNKTIFEENIDLYINGKKSKFKYKINESESKKIEVKFKFKKNLTTMSDMFHNCSSLVSIDLSSFDASNVTNMNGIFYNCSTLESIDLSSFNTSKVTDMSGMFFKCSSLKSIDLSSFDTSKVTKMTNMFRNCFSLESLNLSSFDTINVINMNFMFYKCSSLESIDLSSFITNNVTNISGMFYKCTSLKFLDISSFNTDKVTDMKYIFHGCSLKKNDVKYNKEDKFLNKLLSNS